jgi:hypothetical protein
MISFCGILVLLLFTVLYFFFSIGIVCCIVVCHMFFCVSLSILFIAVCGFVDMFHIQPY